MSNNFLRYLEQTYQCLNGDDALSIPGRFPDDRFVINRDGIVKGSTFLKFGDNVFNYLHLHYRSEFKAAMRKASGDKPQVLDVYFNDPHTGESRHAAIHIWLPDGQHSPRTQVEFFRGKLCKFKYPATINRKDTKWICCGWLLDQ